MRVCLFTILMLGLLWASHAMGANTFVDESKTGGSDTGVDTTNAWLTLDKALESSHSGDDTVFVRGTHDETLSSNIVIISDGTATAPIVVWGDGSGTGANRWWPNDSADSTATITTGAYLVQVTTDHHWIFNHLDFEGITNKGIAVSSSWGCKVHACRFSGFASTSADYGIYASTSDIVVTDCAFDTDFTGDAGTNYGRGIALTSAAWGRITNCTFDDVNSGLYAGAGKLEVVDCEFGQTNPNTYDGNAAGGNIGFLDCIFVDSDGTHYTGTQSSATISVLYLDDSKRPMTYQQSGNYTLTSDYSEVRDGSGAYSLLLESTNVSMGERNPFRMEYAVHSDSGEVRDYAVYCWRDVNWPAPTASELYLEVRYWDADSLKESVSTATLVEDSTWHALTVSGIAPNHAGPVHVALWCKDYDANGKILIDPRMTATDETYHETSYWGQPMLSYLYTAPAAGSRIMMIQ